MKRLNNVKEIFKTSWLLTHFELEKKYKKSLKKIKWTLKIMSKSDVTITKITFKIEETIRQAKEPWEKKRKEITSEIANEVLPWPWHCEKLKDQLIDFTVPLSVSKQKRTEKKVYKWDMALMNKAHDKSKQTVFLYKLFAEIKVKWERKPIKIDHNLVIE